MINLESAYNIRLERGLQLPVDGDYESEQLANIAKRQGELLSELASLDNELLTMFLGIK